jgi:hypothetical protein
VYLCAGEAPFDFENCARPLRLFLTDKYCTVCTCGGWEVVSKLVIRMKWLFLYPRSQWGGGDGGR